MHPEVLRAAIDHQYCASLTISFVAHIANLVTPRYGFFRTIRAHTNRCSSGRHSNSKHLQKLPFRPFAPRLCCPQPSLSSSLSQVFLLKTYSWASEAGKGGNTNAAKVEQENDRRALETCNTLLTRRGLESTGAVPCVSPECGNWMVPEGGGQRVKCSSCLIEFCGR